MLRSLLFALVGIGWAQLPAQAHEEAVGFTELVVIVGEDGTCEPSGCRVEVAHRLSVHDAESTLMNVLGARADLVGDPEAQQKFADYVASRFVLADGATRDSLSLSLLGGEVERGYYWVYQEGQLPPGTSEILVSQAVLMDAIPRQTNRVNIKLDGRVSTLVFSGSAAPQTYSLP